jgi:mono/diheme cytochrome c family protein
LRTDPCGTAKGSTSAAKRRTGPLPLALCLLTSAALAGGCRQDMHDAPRYDPLEASTFLPKGSSAQPLVPGTVARGQLSDDELLYTGKIAGTAAETFPFPITRADLDRGEQRFNIYCSPCHGRTGEGNGMVVQRGYRQAASYHNDRLRQAPVGYFFDVITNGFGAMPDYRGQVTVEDRWRIVAYLRVLQLTHYATTKELSPSDLEKVKTGGTDTPAKTAAGHGGQ